MAKWYKRKDRFLILLNRADTLGKVCGIRRGMILRNITRGGFSLSNNAFIVKSKPIGDVIIVRDGNDLFFLNLLTGDVESIANNLAISNPSGETERYMTFMD